MPATYKCRLCQINFVLEWDMISICPSCCDTLVEPVEEDLYEKAEVACEVVSSYGPCDIAPFTSEKAMINRDTNQSRCRHCNSLDHHSHLCEED